MVTVFALHLDESFGLQAAQIARYQLSHGSNLRRQFLITGRELDAIPDGVFFPVFAIRTSTEISRERTVVKESSSIIPTSFRNRPPTTFKHLKRDLRMYQAERMKILFADEINPGILDCRGGSRIISAIEKRQFGNGAAWAFNCQNLLTAIR